MRWIAALSLALTAATSAHAAPSADERRICELINERRAQHGLSRLQISDALYAAAKSHSDDTALKCKRLQHNSCNGESWTKRVARHYPGWTGLGEVIANALSPEGVVDGWMDSATHRSILLGRNFTEFGCANTLGQTNFGKLGYATVDFGSRGYTSQPQPTKTPKPAPTSAPSPAPVGIDRVKLRSSKHTTTLNARIVLPATARLDAPVALELDGELVATIPASCMTEQGRGARSVCGDALVRINPAGLPRYRIFLRFDGVHGATRSIRLSAAGQTWEVTP